MMNRAKQRGEGNLGCIVWILLGIAAGVFLWNWVPIKLANTELHEFMVEQAKFAQNPRADLFHKRIVAKAKELGLPVTKKDVKVEIEGGRIRMRCKYTVTLNLIVYSYEWKVDHKVERPIFFV